jgi:hypothetical protein
MKSTFCRSLRCLSMTKTYVNLLVAALLVIFFGINNIFAAGYPVGSSAVSWHMSPNDSDIGNPCLNAFLAQTGIPGPGSNITFSHSPNSFAYYSNPAAAAADVSIAFPGQVYLYSMTPGYYVYGIRGCTSIAMYGFDAGESITFSFQVLVDSTAANTPPRGPNGPCPSPNVNLSFGFPGVSASGMYMVAQFTPANNASVESYAHACGFDYIDWQQLLTTLPPGNVEPNNPSLVPNNVAPPICSQLPPVPTGAPLDTLPVGWAANGCSLSTNSGVALPDPPPGDYTYEGSNSYPFYYSINDLGVICSLGPCPPFPYILSSDGNTLSFVDAPSNGLPGVPASSAPAAGDFVAFQTMMVGVSSQSSGGSLPCGTNSMYYCTPLYGWTWNSTFNGDVCKGILSIFGICNQGGVHQMRTVYPIIPGSGTGGVTLTSINSVQLPPVVSPTQVATTASGLAYSRVNQTFNGTLSITNVGNSVISGALQILFTGMSSGVTLTSATGNLSGMPYLTVSGINSLAPGQSITTGVQFKNPSNAAINFTPTLYAGTFQ